MLVLRCTLGRVQHQKGTFMLLSTLPVLLVHLWSSSVATMAGPSALLALSSTEVYCCLLFAIAAAPMVVAPHQSAVPHVQNDSATVSVCHVVSLSGVKPMQMLCVVLMIACADKHLSEL